MSKWKQLLWVVCVFFITSAHAQNKPLACQGDASAGLTWENGSWRASRFKTANFTLVLKGKNLDENSVEKLLTDGLIPVKCGESLGGYISCVGESGEFLYFDPMNMNGAFSSLFGGTGNRDDRDSLIITAFRCRPV